MSLKAMMRRSINACLEPAGFSLRRFQPEMYTQAMESPEILARQAARFREAFAAAVAPFRTIADNIPENSEVEAFRIGLLSDCPVRQDSGGGGVCAAMLLWTIARALRAQTVVESGVFRGFTTWVLHQACPQATQYAFDITFAERKRVESGVSYHEADWMHVTVNVPDRERALVYFDDHVDQWRRIREAAARGFRYLVFDDNLPAEALHNDGMAAVPTVDMLFDRRLVNGQELRWRTECGPFTYRHDATQATQTSRLVEACVRLPDLRFVYGYSPANLTLVVLKREE